MGGALAAARPYMVRHGGTWALDLSVACLSPSGVLDFIFKWELVLAVEFTTVQIYVNIKASSVDLFIKRSTEYIVSSYLSLGRFSIPKRRATSTC